MVRPVSARIAARCEEAPHLRHHFPPRRGQDHADRKLLLYGGAIQMAGTVKARKSSRHATSDWMEVEKQRGISVTSSVMQFEYEGNTINLLDTPGHEDFSEDTYRVLTAVDAAVMVIDAAKGVEAQTIKLLEVCRLRDTPIITFVNKFDREVREPFELLSRSRTVLKIGARRSPGRSAWGRPSGGVPSLRNQLLRFAAGEEKRSTAEIIRARQPAARQPVRGRDPATARRCGLIQGPARRSISRPSGPASRRRCSSARHQQLRRAGDPQRTRRVGAAAAAARRGAAAWSKPPRRPSPASSSRSRPTWIPKHRDRIAFFRICSGRYSLGHEGQACAARPRDETRQCAHLHGQRRVFKGGRVAGDIIGIHNHGQLQIGDTLTEGETLNFKGIPYFSPELFRAARLRDPLKAKRCRRACRSLAKRARSRSSRRSAATCCSARRPMQFEVVAQRLRTNTRSTRSSVGRDLHPRAGSTFPDELTRRNFEREQSMRLGTDVDSNPVYPCQHPLQPRRDDGKSGPRWASATREHGDASRPPDRVAVREEPGRGPVRPRSAGAGPRSGLLLSVLLRGDLRPYRLHVPGCVPRR